MCSRGGFWGSYHAASRDPDASVSSCSHCSPSCLAARSPVPCETGIECVRTPSPNVLPNVPLGASGSPVLRSRRAAKGTAKTPCVRSRAPGGLPKLGVAGSNPVRRSRFLLLGKPPGEYFADWSKRLVEGPRVSLSSGSGAFHSVVSGSWRSTFCATSSERPSRQETRVVVSDAPRAAKETLPPAAGIE